jgi:drug/metabolite transporter (DMT)-like permease
MSWQVLITIQVVLVAIATVITRYLARDRKIAKAGMAITAGWLLVLYLIGLLAIPVIGGVDFNAFADYGWRFIAGGLAFSISNILFFYMLVYLDAAVGTILGTMSAVFTVFGATLFLHENLSNIQIAGTILLLISVTYGVLASRHVKNRSAHVNLAIGAGYALAASIFYAVAALNEKSLLSQISIGSYVLFGWGCQAIIAISAVGLLQPKSLKVFLKPEILGWTVSLGVLRAVSGFCFMLSLIKSNNVGLVTVISNFKLIIIILLGAWLLKERKKIAQKTIAAAGASAALVLLFWR